MNKLSKFYPLTISLGLIIMNFNFFNQYQLLRIVGRILIVLSIILFFVRYSKFFNKRDTNDRTK